MLLVVGACGAAKRGEAAAPKASAIIALCGVAVPMRLVQLCADPVVRAIHGFASPEEARELVERYEALLAPSTVTTRGDGSSSIDRSRTSWSAFLPAGSSGDVIERLEARAVLLAGKPLQFMETLQLVRYENSDQFYKEHYDWFPGEPESQRTTTIFVYLNDTNGEAATVFPRLGLQVTPECGLACMWENSYSFGRGVKVDERLEHAGRPPKTTKKFGINIWFRTLPFRT